MPGPRTAAAVDRLCLRRGVHSVVLSNRLAQSFERSHGSKPFAVIPNGLSLTNSDVGWLAPSSAEIRVISIGRLAPEKGHAILLRAFSEALRVDERLHLTIVGEGPLRGEIEELGRHLGLGARLRLTGFVDRPSELLSASDIFVLPSLWEGMPLVVLEAMLAGVPVVATDVGAIPDMISNYDDGLVVKSSNVAQLATAILDLAGSPVLRQRLTVRAKATVRRYNLEDMVEQYIQAYGRLA